MDNEKDIVYSQAIKAGKRIYYLDVKRNRKGELFLAITESKKIATGEGPDTPYTFEKHKIFLYQEDFTKFIGALSKAIGYIQKNQIEDYRYPIQAETTSENDMHFTEEPLSELSEGIDIKIDFE